MARIKVVTAKKPKGSSKTSKRKPKKNSEVVAIGPKLRLEPRLSPKEDPKKIVNENNDNASIVESDSSVLEEIKIPDVIKFEGDNYEDKPKKRISSAQSKNCNALKKKFDSMKKRDTIMRKKIPYAKKRLVPLGTTWTDRELSDLASGLQFYGFNETEKVASHIKTKRERDVKDVIRTRTNWIRRARMDQLDVQDEEKIKARGRPRNSFTFVLPGHLETWPNERKWRKMAHQQMLSISRNKDYSKDAMVSLVKRFYDEEEEPSDPQVINTKAIYKYMMDCLAGEIPAQLPPKESFIMMDLFRDVTMVPKVYDFTEEREFLANYKGATKYRPIHVKDEFKKRISKPNEENKSVAVTQDIFYNLSHHKRVVQSFNPLTIPVWMLQKEQANLEKFV